MKELYFFQACLLKAIVRNERGTLEEKLPNIVKGHINNVTKKCYSVLRFTNLFVA
jgi:hypothetical protein